MTQNYCPNALSSFLLWDLDNWFTYGYLTLFYVFVYNDPTEHWFLNHQYTMWPGHIDDFDVDIPSWYCRRDSLNILEMFRLLHLPLNTYVSVRCSPLWTLLILDGYCYRLNGEADYLFRLLFLNEDILKVHYRPGRTSLSPWSNQHRSTQLMSSLIYFFLLISTSFLMQNFPHAFPDPHHHVLSLSHLLTSLSTSAASPGPFYTTLSHSPSVPKGSEIRTQSEAGCYQGLISLNDPAILSIVSAIVVVWMILWASLSNKISNILLRNP